MTMESSNMCEKNQDREMVKKLKKSLLKTTLKNSPFDIEELALKQVEKTSTRDGKNQLENPSNLV